MPQIKFHPCLSEEYLQLQQVIEAGAIDAEDTIDLGTAFLIIKEIEANESLEGGVEPVVLASEFLESLDEPYKGFLSGNHLTYPVWIALSSQEAERRIVWLLTDGMMGEQMSVFDGNVEQAIDFMRKLLQFIDEPCHFLTNTNRRIHWRTSDDCYFATGASWTSIFDVGYCSDEGVLIISPKRIGMLWFLSYD